MTLHILRYLAAIAVSGAAIVFLLSRFWSSRVLWPALRFNAVILTLFAAYKWWVAFARPTSEGWLGRNTLTGNISNLIQIAIAVGLLTLIFAIREQRRRREAEDARARRHLEKTVSDILRAS